MKSVENHYADVITMGHPLPATDVAVVNAQGLVLAEDTFARLSIPPYTAATLSGYAVRAADVTPGVSMPVQTDIGTDTHNIPNLHPAMAIRVLKGSPLPLGADTLIAVRKSRMLTEGNGQYPTTFTPSTDTERGANIRHKGEDVEIGSLAFSAGTALSSTHISSLIAVGNTTVTVHRRPIVAVLTFDSTPKENKDTPASIPSPNAALAIQLIAERGGLPRLTPIHGTTTDEIKQQIQHIAGQVDLVVMPGGISNDTSRATKKTLMGTEGMQFDEVAIQPGKSQGWGFLAITPPTTSEPYGFTTLDAHLVPVLCLPNNPISAFVSLHLFVLPLLGALMGYPTRSLQSLFTTETLGTSWRHKVGREQFMPVIRDRNGRVIPAQHKGTQHSHLLSTIPEATGLARVGTTIAKVSEGETIDVFWFSK